MNATSPVRRIFAALGSVFLLLGCPGAARAGFLEKIMHRDVDVITVTDVTDAGKALVPATPAAPIRYKMIYVGQAEFGRSWAGETLPPKKSVIAWMIAAMERQGYLLADAQHPPQQLFVFGWGMIGGGGGRPALGFLGGDKVNLMWEQEGYNGMFRVSPILDIRVLTRGISHMGIAGKVWDIAESDLFLGVVRSFTLDSETAPKVTKLWETRFACPATGLGFDDAMPLMISAAALNFGRETKKPVALDATETFGGQVNFGEFKVLGEADKLPVQNAEAEPVLDAQPKPTDGTKAEPK